MNDQRDLTVVLKSRFPLVVVETHEEARVLALLERIANLESWALFVWSVVEGLKRAGRTDRVPQTNDFRDCLRHVEATPQNGIYVVLDAHRFLEDPINVRLVKEIALRYHETERTLVFVSHELKLPPEIARFAARFELKLPDLAGIRALVKEEVEAWQHRSGERVRGQQDAVDAMLRHLVGLPVEDARRCIRQALVDDGAITMHDVDRATRLKHALLGAEGALTIEPDTARFHEVGGLGALKHWLERRRGPFLDVGGDTGLDAPKGVLLLGVQGSGKSLAAKAVAGSWSVPLLRLDFATLYNKYYGETERNLRQALKAAEAMAPCVLWIDEIEKGLAVDDGADGGLSRRVLGTLLTWMAERDARVFLAATANDVSRLPPELLRKGRFDEIFFVDLPDAPTREEIFRIHLGRRKLAPEGFDVPALAAAADGFSGAEIEQAVVAAAYEAHAAKRPLDTALVAEELARTRPLSIVMAERVAELRAWAAGRTVPAA
ncbi:MAG TPA: AAA family ATPase [Burkholderiales bacterium]|nr:AAA family ATPase [Burkholderiales bacterium]